MIVYRSHKPFDEMSYKQDMTDNPHHGEVSHNIDEIC